MYLFKFTLKICKLKKKVKSVQKIKYGRKCIHIDLCIKAKICYVVFIKLVTLDSVSLSRLEVRFSFLTLKPKLRIICEINCKKLEFV